MCMNIIIVGSVSTKYHHHQALDQLCDEVANQSKNY